jgi:hypothetical protein
MWDFTLLVQINRKQRTVNRCKNEMVGPNCVILETQRRSTADERIRKSQSGE